MPRSRSRSKRASSKHRRRRSRLNVKAREVVETRANKDPVHLIRPNVDIWGSADSGSSANNYKSEGKSSSIIKKKKLPNFGLTGALSKDAVTGNTKDGVVLLHTEPLDRCVSDGKWRLFVFKDKTISESLTLRDQSSFLIGRKIRIVDMLQDHASISSQHAVIQFRSKNNASVPYLIDLNSTNGSKLNGNLIPSSRYVELFSRDEIQIGSETILSIIHEDEEKDTSEGL